MIVGFGEDFGLTAFDHATNLTNKVGSPGGGLFEPGAGNTERNFEVRMLAHFLLDEVKHGTITFGCNFFENALIRLTAGEFVVEIGSAVADIKNGVFAVADGLMNMEVETDGAH